MGKLDYVLGLKIEDFLERRLQTQVFKLGLAKSIHHARVLIKQRHIRVRKQVVNVPSYLCDSTRRSTLTSRSSRPLAVVAQAASSARTPRRVPPAAVTTRNNKLVSSYLTTETTCVLCLIKPKIASEK